MEEADAGVQVQGGQHASLSPSSEEMQRPASSQQQQQQQQQHYPFARSSSGVEVEVEGYRTESGSSLLSLYAAGETTAMQQPLYAAVAPMNGAQMHPPPYAPAQSQYHYQNGGIQPAPMPASGQGGMMRYPIAPQAPLDSRQMSGARGKKEIKRRTKTGCLTCRKRRIKCDEVQPACRNCAKSKRDCLGYDPIFKQQTGPPPIQPAPASSATPTSNPATSPSLSNNHAYHKSQSYPAAGGTFVPASAYDRSAEYTTSLDPALGGEHSLAMARDGFHPNIQPQRKVRFLNMDDLFSLNDVPPRYQQREAPRPLTPAEQHEVADFYKYHYAQGLDRLFETTWYDTQGHAHLQSDYQLQDFVAQCADQFKAATDNPTMTNQIRSLEARLVWQLALMPLASAPSPELAARIDIVDRLVTGQYLAPHQVPPAPTPSPELHELRPDQAERAQAQYRERAFWYNLASFTAARDDRQDTNAQRQVDDALGAMRGILGMLENRDVLYSIAIARHIGGRMPDIHPGRHIIASTADPNDELNKLAIAHKFVEMEDQKGTTQVIQRVCSMALRCWNLQQQWTDG